MKVYYNIKVEGICNGHEEYEIEDSDFEILETYMRDSYAADIIKQKPEWAGRKIEIRPMYNACSNGKDLRYRDWFEAK